ncbi:MAG TPA: hypothetical protein VIK78_17310 [Ruminiclostridium sp.]
MNRLVVGIMENKCVGKLNPDTGESIFSKKYMESNQQKLTKSKPTPVLTTVSKYSFYGATYLFDEIAIN